jgi:hypothetical protein
MKIGEVASSGIMLNTNVICFIIVSKDLINITRHELAAITRFLV